MIFKIKTLYILSLLFILSLCGNTLFAQHALYGLWAKRAAFGSNGEASIMTSIVDENGNVFLSGIFTGTLNFSDNICNPVESTAEAPRGHFLMKIDHEGKYQWHIVYNINEGNPDFATNTDPRSYVFDYQNGRILYYGKFIYDQTGGSLGINAKHSITNEELNETILNETVYGTRTFFTFLHVIDANTGSFISFIPFKSTTHNVTASLQGAEVDVILQDNDANFSRVAVFDISTGNQIGNDITYPDQPRYSNLAGSNSTINKHLTMPDGKQVMLHYSYDKEPGNEEVMAHYLLKYNNDYTVQEKNITLSPRSIFYSPLITTDPDSYLYLATNYGQATYWNTGDTIPDANRLTDFLGTGRDFITERQSNKVVLAKLKPDLSNDVEWMFQIGGEAINYNQVIANDMKTIGDFTYLVGYFMGRNVDFGNGKLLSNSGNSYEWNYDVFYAVYENSSGNCVYAVNIGSSGHDMGQILSLSPDASQVLIGGVYRSSIFQTDPAERLYALSSAGTSNQGFVALYSTDPDSEPVPYPSSFGDSPSGYGVAVHHAYQCIRLGGLDMNNLQSAPVNTVDADSDVNDDGIVIPVTDGFTDFSSGDFNLDASGNLTVKVKVYNSTGENAKVIGWIDFNQDGTFNDEDDASSEAIVNANTTDNDATVNVIWQGAGDKLKNGTTYMRLRITTDNMDNTQPSGLFFNGEVEDYRLDFLVINAENDYAGTFGDKTVEIPVLINDYFIPNCDVTPAITQDPLHGTASVNANKEIVYTPNGDFEGLDSIKYSITCGDELSTATVYVSVALLPDNISNADCFGKPEKTEWNINLFLEYDTVVIVQSPLVGDFDGDGHTDIFVKTKFNRVSGNGVSEGFDILRGPDFNTVISNSTISSAYSAEAIARVKWDDSRDTTVFVLLERATNLLYAYDYNGNILWTGNKVVFSPAYSSIVNAKSIGFADFNNDGYAEVYVGNQIFDAVTGIELCNGGNNNVGLALYSNAAHGVFSVAQNVIGDQRVELCAGSQVYDVNIVSRTTPTLNSMSVIKKVTPQYNSTTIHTDGATVIADFDNDGELEILVQTQGNSTTVTTYGYLYIWKPSTEEMLVMHQLPNAMHRNVPFVGDINGDGKLEIVVLSTNGTTRLMRAFAVNGSTLEQLWSLTHTDVSGSTGLTLFDFNQDGISELVYRDESNLRIINGSLKSHITGNDTIVYNLYSTPAYSGTQYEYPVVADVDGDGHAEILVTANITYDDRYNNHNATLRVYKGSSSSPWAPARKVWNQFMYNVVNINEDLTVPKVQFSPATLFPGENGVFGGGDDVRPYNAFFQQQTILNKNGLPLFLAPDIEWVADPAFKYYNDGDSMIIDISIGNNGDAGLQAPFYVSVYKNSVEISNLVATTSYPNAINVGDILQLSVPVRDLTSFSPITELIIRLNDKGDGAFYQPECDTTNNQKAIQSDILLFAYNDRTQTLIDRGITIDVLFNDSIPVSCGNLVPDITVGPENGTAGMSGNQINYTPRSGFTGVDSLIYKISCNNNESYAKVYINVLNYPDNIDDAACVIDPLATDWSIKEAKSIGEASTYLPSLVGDLDGDGYPEIITGSRMNTTSRPSGWTSSHIGKYIKVFKGPDHSSFNEFTTVYSYYPVMPGVIAVARVNFQGVDTGMIVVAEGDLKLRAYDMHGNNLWTSNANWIDGSEPNSETTVAFADFNNDGKVEVFSGTRIFNAETGELLCQGTANQGLSRHDELGAWGVPITFTVAADIYGDNRLELIAGNQVYEVAHDLSSMRVVREVSPPLCIENAALTIPGDGMTQVIDIDDDGKLEVVVEKWINRGNQFIYIWSPDKQEVLAQKLLKNSNHIGMPFIGDIDGKKDPVTGRKHPEILFIASDYGTNGTGYPPAAYSRIYAYKYNNTSLLEEFWNYPHSDDSGLTGLVLFDFNQDGISEIVYRDMTQLRIINGSKISHKTLQDTVVYNLATFSSFSGTGYECPIVADVDVDGAAEIIIAGGTSTSSTNGNLKIYKSNGLPWAPARKVWNQYAYNAVNVNEDLTIPQYQVNPATAFPGENGILGDSDDVRPYNAFLQQQTMLNKNGLPLFLAPDIEWGMEPAFTYYGDGDSLMIDIRIGNTGDAGLQAPVYISVYKNNVETSNLVTTISYPNTINVGDVVQLSFPIRDLSSVLPLTELLIRLNDRGEGSFYQQECDTLNNTQSIKLSSLGFDDYYGAYNDDSGNASDFNILENDISELTQMTTIVSMASSAGSVISVNSGSIESLHYQPATGFTGIDTIKYMSSGLTGLNVPVYVYGSAYIYVYSNKARQCHNEPGSYSIQIIDPFYDVTVDWKHHSDGSDANTLSASSLYGPVDFDLEAEVTFNVSTTPVAAFNNDIETPFTLEVVPLQLYWDKSASNTNWNDPANWVDVNGLAMQAVPLSCTSVHIPGDADNYPSLDSLSTPRTVYYASPECDSIVFHFGAEVAKPNYLTYNKAFIQYNFGYYSGGYNYLDDGDAFSASAMERGRWYALSAPLKKMVTGDFSLGGKPNTWQKGFVRSESSGNFIGEWVSPSSDNAIPLDESLAYSISLWIGEYLPGVVGEGEGYQDGLNGLKGIIEIPYFENSVLSNYHRIHHYNGTASLFDYYYFEVPGVPIEPSQPRGSITRGDESYRFIFDGEIVRIPDGADQGKEAFKLSVPAGSELMVGNPFLSSLDFRKFYEANSTKIEDYYRLYVNNVWEEYSYALGSQALDEYIAPLQAFFITTSGSSSGSVDLYFPFESVSVTRPSGEALQLRNLEPGLSDVLYVTARNLKTGESNSVSLGLGTIPGDEASKLFYGEPEALSVPQLYFGEGSGNRKAIGVTGDAIEEVPLGLRGANGANIALEFSNIDNLHVDALFLFDKQDQAFTNLLEESTYSFQNTGDGSYHDRFMLIMKHSEHTSIDPLEPTLEKVSVYVSERILYIHSDIRIESAEIYNTQGMKVYSRSEINNRSFTEYLSLPQGVYLVKVKLINGKENIEKIIIK